MILGYFRSDSLYVADPKYTMSSCCTQEKNSNKSLRKDILETEKVESSVSEGSQNLASCATQRKRRSEDEPIPKPSEEQATFQEFSEDDPKTDKTLKAYIRDVEKCSRSNLSLGDRRLKALTQKQRNDSPSPNRWKKHANNMRRSTNPTIAFVQDNCHVDAEKHIEKDHFYRCLKKYCEQYKLPTPNASTFGQKLKEMTDWVITAESIYDSLREKQSSLTGAESHSTMIHHIPLLPAGA